jgi:N-acetylglucosaminyl-diphospho-decaprenol L-rhamnosyltransferase
MKFLNKITAIIVTYKSSDVLFELLKILDSICNIIIVENSNNILFKIKIEKNFDNVKCILVNKNIGYGRAANIGILSSKTEYLLLINPDAKTNYNSIKNLYNFILKQNNAMLAPMNYTLKKKLWHRFGYLDNRKINNDNNLLFDVDYVSGHMILINKNIFKKIGFFDKNIFLNFEDRDLCMRLKKNNYKIYVLKNAKVEHLEGKSSFSETESLKKLKWHFGWSMYYFYKKHFGYKFAIKITVPYLFKNILKLILSCLLFKKKSIITYLFQIKGLLHSYFGSKSFYR